MLAIIMVMSSYYSGEDEERQKKTVEPKKDESDSTFSEENKDTKGKNPKRNPKEDI
jgi:lipopolysaccharide export system protein LptC